ncbi:TIR domain-containing protein [Rhodoferax sp. WC2427]|uniref:toll/interleukin-1 receptor domain-containing protein n=1 Tax=Rhodoferax sp. WC2427 TaxID=3234144 RepID=UPI003465C7AA
MADIFLSYNEKDRPRVRQLAQALERAGWSVWWDRRVPAGLTWRSLLEQELQNMRCMLVLWSNNSVKSEWVCEEATEGRLLGRLIPVFLERVRPPAGFREVQAADLVDWDGTSDTIGLQQLLDDIAHKLGNPAVQPPDPALRVAAQAPPPPQPTPTLWNPWKQGAWMAALLLVAVGIYLGVGAVKHREAVVPMADPPAASTPSAAVVAEPPTFGMPTTLPNMAPATPAPVVIAATPPAKLPPVTAAAPAKRTLPARCNAIHDRQGLGETPSAADQAFLNKEC